MNLLSRQVCLLAALSAFSAGIDAAVTITGSSFTEDLPAGITDARSLQEWYHARGYVWVNVNQIENTIVVSEHPLIKIIILPEREKTVVARYIQLKLHEPLNKILLEEQLQSFYHSIVFQERYAKLTIQPDIYPQGMVLTISAELKPRTEIILFSQDARGPGLYGQTHIEYENNSLAWYGTVAAIISNYISWYSAKTQLQMPGLFCRAGLSYFRDEVFSLHDGRAQAALCPATVAGMEFYTGYRLDAQSRQQPAHQLAVGFSWGHRTWQQYGNYGQAEAAYDPQSHSWRFYGSAQATVAFQHSMALSSAMEFHNRKNMSLPLDYLPYRSHETYIMQNLSLSLFPHWNFRYLRLGPWLTTRPLNNQAAAAIAFELIAESFYGRFFTGVTESGELFVRLFAESRL